ncbi:multidrug resistance protein 1-like [Stylophora pistillata]|uniref:multidrug resistance protein 1-like n=1 Tax=Stylophora pistillata TaxID=50429 RepID=UPI000C04FE14|nr:multidrug resistance protein 1-like [Stylophora pistillata]
MVSARGMVPLPGTPTNGYNALALGSQLNSGEVHQGGIPSIRGVMPTTTHYNAKNVPSYTDQRGIQEFGGMGLPPNMPNPRPDLLVLPDPQQQADQLMSQVEKDVEAALQNSIGKYLGPKVQETISSISTLGMALYNGWKMTLVVLAGLPIIGLANRIQQNEAVTVEPEGVEALMKTSFKKMETISALGMENKFAKKYKDAIFEKYKQALKKIIASGFAFALGQAMVFFIYAGALRFGCYLISIGDMAAIEVLGVLMTVLFGSYATSSTRAPSHAHEENEDSVNRLFDDEKPNVQDHIGDHKLDEVEGNLEFKHVELPDPLHNGTPLLSQMNVKVRKGQKLAIVLLDSEKVNPFELLLERFFDPVAGTLLLDGADIRNLDLSWLRSHHAVVSHRCFLSHYSIADNIAYGDNRRRVTQTEIEDAAYSAYAHEFIGDLPKSYETIPDEDQIKLSDSQKLRIVIARAIIRGSPLIILDQLEEEDQAVTDATDILFRNRTCLILTRQRQTIETADHIILMYHGRILEQGSLNELLAQRRLFYLLTNLADADEF